jgi:DNA-binding MarR family transcriptional regulator
MDDYITQTLEAASALTSRLDRALMPHDLSSTQYRLLRALRGAPRLTPGQLAGVLVQQPHSVSGMLNRLEDRGLLDRVRAKEDRRVIWCMLTPAGQALLDKANEDFKAIADDFDDHVNGTNRRPPHIRDAALRDVPIKHFEEYRAAALEAIDA